MMICRICTKEIPEESMYCPYCGYDLNSNYKQKEIISEKKYIYFNYFNAILSFITAFLFVWLFVQHFIVSSIICLIMSILLWPVIKAEKKLNSKSIKYIVYIMCIIIISSIFINYIYYKQNMYKDDFQSYIYQDGLAEINESYNNALKSIKKEKFRITRKSIIREGDYIAGFKINVGFFNYVTFTTDTYIEASSGERLTYINHITLKELKGYEKRFTDILTAIVCSISSDISVKDADIFSNEILNEINNDEFLSFEKKFEGNLFTIYLVSDNNIDGIRINIKNKNTVLEEERHQKIRENCINDMKLILINYNKCMELYDKEKLKVNIDDLDELTYYYRLKMDIDKENSAGLIFIYSEEIENILFDGINIDYIKGYEKDLVDILTVSINEILKNADFEDAHNFALNFVNKIKNIDYYPGTVISEVFNNYLFKAEFRYSRFYIEIENKNEEKAEIITTEIQKTTESIESVTETITEFTTLQETEEQEKDYSKYIPFRDGVNYENFLTNDYKDYPIDSKKNDSNSAVIAIKNYVIELKYSPNDSSKVVEAIYTAKFEPNSDEEYLHKQYVAAEYFACEIIDLSYRDVYITRPGKSPGYLFGDTIDRFEICYPDIIENGKGEFISVEYKYTASFSKDTNIFKLNVVRCRELSLNENKPLDRDSFDEKEMGFTALEFFDTFNSNSISDVMEEQEIYADTANTINNKKENNFIFSFEKNKDTSIVLRYDKNNNQSVHCVYMSAKITEQYGDISKFNELLYINTVAATSTLVRKYKNLEISSQMEAFWISGRVAIAFYDCFENDFLTTDIDVPYIFDDYLYEVSYRKDTNIFSAKITKI